MLASGGKTREAAEYVDERYCGLEYRAEDVREDGQKGLPELHYDRHGL